MKAILSSCLLEVNGNHRLKTLLTCQLGESPISIKVMVTWMRSFQKGKWIVSSIDEEERPEHALCRYNQLKPISVVLISTLSGSIIRLSRLDSDSFTMLKSLETVLSKHSLGKPLLGHSYFYYRGRYRVNHIDGDMVKQFLKLSSDERNRIISLMDLNVVNVQHLISTLVYLYSQ